MEEAKLTCTSRLVRLNGSVESVLCFLEFLMRQTLFFLRFRCVESHVWCPSCRSGVRWRKRGDPSTTVSGEGWSTQSQEASRAPLSDIGTIDGLASAASCANDVWARPIDSSNVQRLQCRITTSPGPTGVFMRGYVLYALALTAFQQSMISLPLGD